MNDNKHTLQPLDEYIRQSEPEQRERGQAWRVAIGLQQVDGLTTSEYLLDTAGRCKKDTRVLPICRIENRPAPLSFVKL